jgi:hypothetical protein
MPEFDRRRFLASLAALGGGALLASPVLASSRKPSAAPAATGPSARAHDWDWLRGHWTVHHQRLKERLAGSDEWQTFAGSSTLWATLGGLGTIDDNLVELPGDPYRGISVRAYDPATDRWSIWWLDGRNPAALDTPVLGRFDGSTGTFTGRATFQGRPIVMRFRWRDIHGARPWWEQAFSADDGATWEVNWRNYFSRVSADAVPLPALPDANRDWDFLAGRWNVRHRRLRHRHARNEEWDAFDGTLTNWPVLGGHGNVGDNVMHFPDGTVRGVGFRAFDPATRQWSSWWLDGRDPARIAAPMHGRFADGVATMLGDDTEAGRPVTTRVRWSRITARSARWEQAGSLDGGATWETNWISDFTRRA